ncbi:hypothetical protein HYS42_00955 [Candidatus Saccharibacteria bacterium]|nr:hypothetical protein [Candidatus Saccharibacteria bacterium]
MPSNNDIERALQRARESARISEADRAERQKTALRDGFIKEQERVSRIRQASASFLQAMVDADTPGIELLYQRKKVIWSDKPGTKEVAGWTVASRDVRFDSQDHLWLLVNGVYLRTNANEKKYGGVVHKLGEFQSTDYIELENQIPANLGTIALRHNISWRP